MTNTIQHYLQIQFRNPESPRGSWFDINDQHFPWTDRQRSFDALAARRSEKSRYSFRLVEIVVTLVTENAITDAPEQIQA